MLVAGQVGENMVRIDGKELQMIMITNESLGNCPKVYFSIAEGADSSTLLYGISSIFREKGN